MMSVFPSHFPGTGEDIIYAQLIQNTMDIARDAELKLEMIREQVTALRDEQLELVERGSTYALTAQSSYQAVLDLLKPEVKS